VVTLESPPAYRIDLHPADPSEQTWRFWSRTPAYVGGSLTVVETFVDAGPREEMLSLAWGLFAAAAPEWAHIAPVEGGPER
jgi:cytosine/uracil/thiamine/allantoin permease